MCQWTTSPCSFVRPGCLSNRLQPQLARNAVTSRWNIWGQENRQQARGLCRRIENGVETTRLLRLACQSPRFTLLYVAIGAAYEAPDDVEGFTDIPAIQR